jgi:V8-like Glu-specific endopeptidase
MATRPAPADSYRRWLADLRQRDPQLYAELDARLRQRVAAAAPEITYESAVASNADRVAVLYETIVRDGRPAFPIKNNTIVEEGVIEVASKTVVDRLRDAAPRLAPIIPLVGRIDVENFAGGAKFLGTGWLIDSGLVVTNRHVAELVARWEGSRYRFRPGFAGRELRVSLDYRHEKDIDTREAVDVVEVLWIEENEREADIAFLKVTESGTDRRQGIPLAASDARPNAHVAVIGYPARADRETIPDQARMDRIYGGTYDVKRVAPGQIQSPSDRWATHDCTTLGGNSGSVVVDLTTGEAVGLHFAGLYMIENYAVPASVVRRYLTERPWQNGRRTRDDGRRTRDDGGRATDGEVRISIRRAARKFEAAYGGKGVLAVRAGYVVERGRLTDEDCIAVSAEPSLVNEVRERVPSTFEGYPVQVRPASLADQMAAFAPRAPEAVGFDNKTLEAAITSISYDDSARTGDGFSFDWIEEDMKVTAHVGPERSWSQLSAFLAGAKKELVSSIYEFHAKHVADAIEGRLTDKVKMSLVVANQSRDPKNNGTKPGEFDRSDTFERWRSNFKFDNVFVPTGSSGLVANAYHIKVTVRDRSAIWLSSGNWKHTSQPVIAAADLGDPKVTGRSGNREWHVVVENETLAARFRNHILQDRTRSTELGGTFETLAEQLFIDVPAVAEGVVLERAPDRVLEPKQVNGTIRVMPLLTPDRKGAVYSKSVLRLMRSARKQLVFQNQYIKVANGSNGFFDDLVELLIEKAETIDDVRIIVRAGDGVLDDASELKRRGLDVNRCLRRLSNTHTKGIVVDGKRVLLGSQNWSQLGVTLNRDASLIFDNEEIATYFLEAFELDWARSTPISDEMLEEGVPQLAGSDTPVRAGYVRVPVSEFAEG